LEDAHIADEVAKGSEGTGLELAVVCTTSLRQLFEQYVDGRLKIQAKVIEVASGLPENNLFDKMLACKVERGFHGKVQLR